MNSAYHRLYRTLGINIAYYRNMKDMSQEQLGDRLEIDQSHVSKIVAELKIRLSWLFLRMKVLRKKLKR